ncbi:hypothetical protein L226DRAFT_548049 [Lentinus tigrinus ALCF2SS1-7]|uniref:uncharacterized protein n=1 Tax=Lentinus tigrinus ALCF2SS1-7 TaxID=1328758 RepID=UPI001165DE0D|nr:hypothetical protein L226DRAFT_548049 [Lentinus tigrinus ALCF2SS1-7]
MASPYQAYPGSPREPSSNIPYASVGTAPTYPYPPNSRYDGSAASLDSDSSSDPERDKPSGLPKQAIGGHVAVDVRAVNRTPSPTPSEAKELAKNSVFDWEAMLKWRYWIRRDWLWYYVIFIVCLVGVILFTVYHSQIVNWLKPAATWMHDLPYGWTIPIAVLFVISFPPLFGHEIVAILCGLVWGLGPGFGIVAAGTFLGELGNFYAFKYCCSARGEKLERTKLSYACLARVVREGGFKIALIARLSAIPGHFTTAVFSTCGMGVITFSIAAILSLPKQFITVYLGVALEQSQDGTSSTSDTIIKDVVLGVTTLITIGAMWYIYHQMNKVKPQVIYDRRKARQAKMNMASAPSLPYGNPAVMQSTASVAAFNPAASGTDIPLTKYGQPSFNVYAPQPRRAEQPMSERPYAGAALPPGAGYAYPVPPSQQRVTSPPRDPFADSHRGMSYQRQAPPRGYGSPPPETFTVQAGEAPRYRTKIHTATRQQSEHAQTQHYPSTPPSHPSPPVPQLPSHSQAPPPPLPSMAPPSTSPPKNPFSDPAPMVNPYDAAYGVHEGHGHEAEASDATFYTAAGGHSRGVTEDESYDGSETVHGGSSDAHSLPPSYESLPPR